VTSRILGALLRVQGRMLGPVVGLGMVAAVALPLATIQGLGGGATGNEALRTLLFQSERLAAAYQYLALCAGAFVAVATWLPDIGGRWVYAFTLPVPRANYAAARFASGLALLVPVALALWVAALVATAVVHVPAAVQAHPHLMTLRFLVSAWIVYAAVSVLVLSGRAAWAVPVAVTVLLLLSAAGHGAPLDLLSDALFLRSFSPFRVLLGPWMLFDV
jgi:hypothetical protein